MGSSKIMTIVAYTYSPGRGFTGTIELQIILADEPRRTCAMGIGFPGLRLGWLR